MVLPSIYHDPTNAPIRGGSGKALINIPEEWKVVKVYNDINRDLCTTFKVLQDERKYRLLARKLRNAFPHAEIFNELRHSHPRSDVDVAFKTIYLHTYSYAGTGIAFKRFYTKVNVPPLKMDHFPEGQEVDRGEYGFQGFDEEIQQAESPALS